ncbi:cytochrome P450 [Coprinopsis marcescibilis]|uniref:Cytochrome P450 n=1 Tax=Coprinopsis marcescibilis TaxID=230819 RepID=A0A5C3LD59_COPMA|nr:cytochrome P450 [Coprinopsis marcescibilis]
MASIISSLPVATIAAGTFSYFLVSQLLSGKDSLRHVPGPPPSSYLWGEEWELYYGSPGAPYIDWHRKYGKVVRFNGAMGHRVISITDPKAISYILVKNAYAFPKAKGVRAWFDATIGRGIIWAEGRDAHEPQRQLLAPSLSPQRVRGLIPVLLETAHRLAAQWANVCDQAPTSETQIEVTNWANRLALDTIGLAAFGYDFDCLSGKPDALADALDGLTNNEHKVSSFYMRALFWLFPPILSIGEKGKMIRKTKHELGIIASRMWRDAKVAADREDKTVMAYILNADEENIDEEYIVSQMRAIISAGYEPVSAALAWILYELGTHIDVQTALREEVIELKDTTADGINKLKLLDAVIKETFRLHPPILENHHEAGEDVVIPLETPIAGTQETHLVVPAGTLLAIPLNVIHKDPGVWGLDANEFNPQRWLNPEKAVSKEQRLMTFSEGPRGCIGRSFAMMELKVTILTLLQQFSFRCQCKMEEFQSFVVRPRVVGETASSLPLLVARL